MSGPLNVKRRPRWLASVLIVGVEPTAAQPIVTAHYDEWHDSVGHLDERYDEFFERFSADVLTDVSRRIARRLGDAGCNFRSADGLTPFHVDPVPRLLSCREWATVSAGAEQRVKALEHFIADIYGDGLILAEQLIPHELVLKSRYYEPLAKEFAEHTRVWAGVAGLDLVRPADGSFTVLEDNTRTPSGIAYAIDAREALAPEFSGLGWQPVDQKVTVDLLAQTLRSATAADDPQIVVLSDGQRNSAWHEHSVLAGTLSVPLVTLADIEKTASGEVFWRDQGERRKIDVIYRRTDCDYLQEPDGSLTSIAAVLLEPLRRGKVACVNAFGSGIADDKAIHAYVEDMIGFYLTERPILESVPTYRPSEPDELDQVLQRFGELVIKPRAGLGGKGVVVCKRARPDDVEAVRAQFARCPEKFVAQELIDFSMHPTLIDRRVEPRHVDLRPYIYSTPDQQFAAPAALTRVALDEDALVVNTSQNGGGKDTWILT